MTPQSTLRHSAVEVLIAEDSPTQAAMLADLLQQQGYSSSVAVNGQQALDMARQRKPTLIISDVVMPVMDGYALCKAIKADSELREVPVVIVTSLTGVQDIVMALDCGADNFIRKPYEPAALLARIDSILSNRESLHNGGGQMPLGLEIYLGGKKHFITSEREQILDLLISSYEQAIQVNEELKQRDQVISSLNADLELRAAELEAANHKLIESQELLRERTIKFLDANRFLESMIEHLPNPIFIKDAEQLRYACINRAYETLVGLSRAYILGKSAHEVFEKEDADSLVAEDHQALASRTVLEIPEQPFASRTLGKRVLHTRKVPVLGEGNQPTHLLGISEDVTDQKKMQSEVLELNTRLKQRAEELEASIKSMESFTAAASHDLRSPLHLIDGYVGLLEKNYASTLNETGRRYLSIISRNAKSMSNLIEDLMNFSRLGLQEVKKDSVDMHQLVAPVIDDILQHFPEGKKPVFRLEPLPPARADSSLIRQVWVNLLSNAVKYSSRAPSPLIEVCGYTKDSEVVYSVRDNGAGFDMAHYDKLFEIFKRLHTNQEFEGTGVGLPIVQRVVNRHGGRVWAEGSVGRGATFHFALPVQ